MNRDWQWNEKNVLRCQQNASEGKGDNTLIPLQVEKVMRDQRDLTSHAPSEQEESKVRIGRIGRNATPGFIDPGSVEIGTERHTHRERGGERETRRGCEEEGPVEVAGARLWTVCDCQRYLSTFEVGLFNYTAIRIAA